MCRKSTRLAVPPLSGDVSDQADLWTATGDSTTFVIDEVVGDIGVGRQGDAHRTDRAQRLPAFFNRVPAPRVKAQSVVDAHLAGSSITAMGTTTSTTGCHQKVR